MLCIDDNEQGLAIRKLFLETFGYRVSVASSGAEGLRLLSQQEFSVVLLDYRMPEMDGEAAAREIKGKYPDVPIVMLSGYASEIPARAWDSVDGFVRKGRPPAEFLAEIERLVEGKSKTITAAASEEAHRKWQIACRQVEEQSHDRATENRLQQARTEETLRSNAKLASAGRMAATITHEINGPLESVNNALYLLDANLETEHPARRYLDIACGELARVRQITSQTLSFYRESSKPVPVALPQILESVLELYGRKIRYREIAVHKKYEVSNDVQGFPGELRQVFSNLIINAVDAVDDKGTIRLHVHHSVDWRDPGRKGVSVLVADNGRGISQANVHKIFEPFFTTKGEKGTGVGLWVSRDIIQKHGGRIRVRSSVRPHKHGTCFVIFLPENAFSEGRQLIAA